MNLRHLERFLRSRSRSSGSRSRCRCGQSCRSVECGHRRRTAHEREVRWNVKLVGQHSVNDMHTIQYKGKLLHGRNQCSKRGVHDFCSGCVSICHEGGLTMWEMPMDRMSGRVQSFMGLSFHWFDWAAGCDPSFSATWSRKIEMENAWT